MNLQSAAVTSYPTSVQMLITSEIIIHYCQTPSLLGMKQMLTSLKDVDLLFPKPEIQKSVFALNSTMFKEFRLLKEEDILVVYSKVVS